LIRRDDDVQSTIARRLLRFEQETHQILAQYAQQGLLVTIDGHGSPDQVARRVERALSA
jgi:adenylate kinase